MKCQFLIGIVRHGARGDHSPDTYSEACQFLIGIVRPELGIVPNPER